jgi:hypothetical protein
MYRDYPLQYVEKTERSDYQYFAGILKKSFGVQMRSAVACI